MAPIEGVSGVADAQPTTTAQAANEAAATQTRQTQRLLDAGLVGVLSWNITGGIVDANDTLLEMLGYTREDLNAGRIDWIELTPPEMRSRDMQPIADLYATGKHLPFEKQYLRKDGTRVPILVASTFNEGSQTDGVGFVVNISAQKNAEREAHDRSQEIVTIFESMTDAFFALDAEWRFTYINAEAESLLHRTRDELIGAVFWDEFPEVVETTFGTEFRRAVSENVAIAVEGFYAPLEGWFEVRAFPSRTGNGLAVYFRNVSDRKRAEQERERLLEQETRLVADLREASIRQRRFLKEMLAGFTEGKLRLCYSTEELPGPLSTQMEDIELSAPSLQILRRHVQAAADSLEFDEERAQDLISAVGEAAMNAVQHGGGGTASVCCDREQRLVQVCIRDCGKGIREEDLHRATLEKGWSGAESFGHGFYIILRTADRTFLLTGEHGTTVVIEQEAVPPLPAWLQGKI